MQGNALAYVVQHTALKASHLHGSVLAELRPSRKQEMASIQVQKATSSKVRPQNGAQVSLTNQTSNVMKLDRSKDWSGFVATSLPTTILPGESVTFAHLSDGDFGSRAAVVYSGANTEGVPCGFILAWDAPAYTDHSPNKVYVVCGLKPFIDHLDFNQIRLSLSVSTSASNAADPATKTIATATITDSIPNKATVEAKFSLIP